MKASEVKLHEFMRTPKIQFVIPVYQRNYDWTKKQCTQLVTDILNAGSQKENTTHFVGSIVYIHDDLYQTFDVKKYTIIDGQQRLTTMILLWIAIYNYARRNQHTDKAEEVYEEYLTNKRVEESLKIRLKATGDNAHAIRYLIEGQNPKDYQGKAINIIDNYLYFEDLITESNLPTLEQGIKRLSFIEVTLERGKDDPQKIFESLNSTGMELSPADLIRNYILMDLPPDQQTTTFNSYWKVIEENAQILSKSESRVSDFIRDYMTQQYKSIPAKKRIYEEFKKQYNYQDFATIQELLEELKDLSRYYARLLNPQLEKDRHIQNELKYLQRLEVNVSFPFLIKVYQDYGKERISREAFLEVLRLVQSFVFRRFVAALPTNALNKIFMMLYQYIDYEDYVGSLARYLVQRKGTQRFPQDEEVYAMLKEKDIYNTNSKNRNYLLSRLEHHNNNEPVNLDSDLITVEHIFPRNPATGWRDKLSEEEFLRFEQKYLNTLANLTYSGNNGALGNKTFTEKRDMPEKGYRDSSLFLNRYLGSLDHWNEETYNTRFEHLWTRFKAVWKFPYQALKQTDLGYEEEEVNLFEAETPKGKKLAYFIFQDTKYEEKAVAKMYEIVLRRLFEDNPAPFQREPLKSIVELTTNPDNLRTQQEISDHYFIEKNLGNESKFKRLKQVLTELDMQDELLVKYE